MKNITYHKISRKKLLEVPNLIWNNRLADHIANEIHQGTYDIDYNDLLSFPEVIRHLHFLWRAQCDLGASGFAYLYEAVAKEIVGIYEAFVAIEASELTKLMGEAIALANQFDSTEYSHEIKGTQLTKWFDQFTDRGEFNDLEGKVLMTKAETLSTKYLDEKILTYIYANLDIISELP